ncbi:hypothetical protein BKA62DRAFT_50610 [Auriculariales sp. MPI-PUGE-AT-0066]|nr:hypothetical protein BKA62DRAFT_50610 [Auriculariales sp. MPI-PUGE-AT-0066]
MLPYFFVLPISPAVATYILATASDIGFLQAKSGLACYSPNPSLVGYPSHDCTDALLSGALYNHLDAEINPEAPSTAYYDNQLSFLGDYTWHVPNTTERSQIIACHQGPLPLTAKHGEVLFHTWCHFVTGDNQFSFREARDTTGVCSRVHVGGVRAARDDCVSPPSRGCPEYSGCMDDGTCIGFGWRLYIAFYVGCRYGR